MVEKTKDQILDIRAREKIKNLDTLSAIREYYMSDLPVKLSKSQERVRKRILTAYMLEMKALARPIITRILCRAFDISKAQAWKDTRNAFRLFGDVNHAEKEGVRTILYEWSKSIYAKAKAAGDLQQANAAIANMIKIQGIDKHDPDLPDFSKLEPSFIPIVLDERIRELLNTMLDKPTIDLSSLMNQLNTEDAQIADDNGLPDQGRD